MEKYTVFISFKNTDNGEPTKDAVIAQALYKKLTENNISVFFSNTTLLEKGSSQFKNAIEEALESAIILILVGSKTDYIMSKWVNYEWDTFHNEILSDAKPNGIIIPYLSETIRHAEKPMSLRRLETFLIERDTIDDVCTFIRNYMKEKGLDFEDYSQNKYNTGLSMHSKYSALTLNEEQRLNIQCELTRCSDMPGINLVTEKFKDEEKIYILDLGCARGTTIKDRFQNYPLSNLHVNGIDKSADIIEIARKECEGLNFHFAAIEVESDDFEKNIAEYMRMNNIPGFHLVISTVFLRHMKNPTLIMKRIRNILVEGGCFLIREQDDGTRISNGDFGLVEKITDRFVTLPGVSDRYYGRKVNTQLIEAGFNNIKALHKIRDTSGKTEEEKAKIFNIAFMQLINYAEYLIEQNPDNSEIRSTFDWLETALEKLYAIFMNQDFWYTETDFVFLAEK